MHKILFRHMNRPVYGQTENVKNQTSAAYTDYHSKVLITQPSPVEILKVSDTICKTDNQVIKILDVEPLLAFPFLSMTSCTVRSFGCDVFGRCDRYPREPIVPSKRRFQRIRKAFEIL